MTCIIAPRGLSHRFPAPVLVLVLLSILPAAAPSSALAQEGALIVTEIHCDPQELSDENGEWIEVYNQSAQEVDLRDWSLEDRQNDAHQIRSETPLFVEPGQYAVLARRSEILRGMGIPVLYAYGDDFVLDDLEDEVLLVDEQGILSDAIAYDRTAGWPSRPGHAMAWTGSGNRHQPESWRDAPYEFFTGDYGSPGAPNDQVPLGAPAPVESEPQPAPRSSIYAELMRGDLADDLGLGRARIGDPPQAVENEAWVLRFGARVQVSRVLGFRMEFPFASGSHAVQRIGNDGQPHWEEISDSTLGNIYLGAIFDLGQSGFAIETGVHMPVSSDSSQTDGKVASLVGAATDWVTGLESFAQDAVPVSLRLRQADLFPGALVLGGEAALHVWFPVDGRDDTVAFFQYGVQGGLDLSLLRGGVGVYGRYQTRGSEDERDNDFIHEARVFAEARLGPFRPGAEYRRGISSELTDLFDATYVLRLAIELP